jgi:hypothetical protein
VAPYVGYAPVPTVAGPVEIEWSLEALADLDRFAMQFVNKLDDDAKLIRDYLADAFTDRTSRTMR